jgi:hypothetical protein
MLAAWHVVKPEVIPKAERRPVNLPALKRLCYSFYLIQSSLLAFQDRNVVYCSVGWRATGFPRLAPVAAIPVSLYVHFEE